MSACYRPVIALQKRFETSSVVWVIMIVPNMAQMHTASRRIDRNIGFSFTAPRWKTKLLPVMSANSWVLNSNADRNELWRVATTTLTASCFVISISPRSLKCMCYWIYITLNYDSWVGFVIILYRPLFVGIHLMYSTIILLKSIYRNYLCINFSRLIYRNQFGAMNYTENYIISGSQHNSNIG